MRPERSAERTAAILISAFLVAVIASVALAPMIFAEGCPGSAAPDDSCRQSPPRTLLGYEANQVWLWAATMVATALVTVWLIRRAAPNRK